MQPKLFDFNNFPLIGNYKVSEVDSFDKNKTKEYLFPVENCDALFEILQGKLRYPNYDNSNNFNELPECKTVLRRTNILGEYFSDKQSIEYYYQSLENLEITKIHERFHAIHHLTLDNNGAIWDGFKLIPPFYKELLAQLFTWIYIKNNSSLNATFKELNKTQPFIYKTYKIFEHYNQQEAEKLYWDIRNKNTNDRVFKDLEKIMKPKKQSPFKRELPRSIINKLLIDPLYINKLKKDIENGVVFPAIRPKNLIDFYYKGGRLFQYDNKEFNTHIKYAAVIDKRKNDYLKESELKHSILAPDFSTSYPRIKENCALYAGDEAKGVSNIYHKYSYATGKHEIVVLDIEVSLSSPEDDKTLDRIDILLYNTAEKKLKFVEAKHYSNKEIWSKTIAKVINQIDRYENQIKIRKTEIISGYNNYIIIANDLFNIKLPDVQDIDERVTLLIFDFDNNQKNGRLKGLIKRNQNFKDYRIYTIGGINNLILKNLWNSK